MSTNRRGCWWCCREREVWSELLSIWIQLEGLDGVPMEQHNHSFSVSLSLALPLSPSQTYSFSLVSPEGVTASSSFFPGGGVSAPAAVFGSSAESFSSTNLSSLPVC